MNVRTKIFLLVGRHHDDCGFLSRMQQLQTALFIDLTGSFSWNARQKWIINISGYGPSEFCLKENLSGWESLPRLVSYGKHLGLSAESCRIWGDSGRRDDRADCSKLACKTQGIGGGFCLVYRKTHTLLLLFPPWDQCKQQCFLNKYSESCSQNHILHSQRQICILLKPPKVHHKCLLHCQVCTSVADKEKFRLPELVVLLPPPPVEITTWRAEFCKDAANFQL